MAQGGPGGGADGPGWERNGPKLSADGPRGRVMAQSYPLTARAGGVMPQGPTLISSLIRD